MATLIPSLNSCLSRMTAGEKRFARSLESHLDDDYLIWYDIPIGDKRLHPDFIVLHPLHGIFILEVKDWKLDTLQQINPESVTLLIPDGVKEAINPLKQARGYALAVCKMLERDNILIQDVGRYQGKLAFPYGYGVVFTNITRKMVEVTTALEEGFEPNLVICKDEITEGVDPGRFQQQLWNLSYYQFGQPLTPEQIDRVRWHLFPDLRITAQQLALFPDEAVQDAIRQEQVIPDLITIMDLQQEQLARSMGDGHRVIHGVAGSGKTLILAYRCQYLAQDQSKRILVLCFNVSLASRLRHMIRAKQLSGTIVVRHFHGWCGELLTTHRLPKPDPKQYHGEAYVNRLVSQVIQAVADGIILKGQYSAILIDEGHDFQPEWLKLIAQMVDPSTNALLLLYDDAQTLYQQKRQQRFSFKSVGIQAQGRTTILKLNYRNTLEVLTLAYEFAREVLVPTVNMDDDDMPLVQPQSAGRHGVSPELVFQSSYAQECIYLARKFQEFHNQGIAWSQMAIVYRVKWMAETLNRHFQNAGLPIEWLNQSDSSRHYQPEHDSIKVMTLHSSKGLEFQVLGIPGLGYLPYAHESIEDETRLLYVGITRAMDRLLLTYHQRSAIVEKLQRALATIKYS